MVNGSYTSHDDGNNTFVMREKLLTFGKDFEIKEASHRRGGHGPGKAISTMSIIKSFVLVRLLTFVHLVMERYCIKSKNGIFVFVIP